MTDLRCDEFVELVTAFLDGALDERGELRFVEHLSRCEGCRRYLDQMRQTIRALLREFPLVGAGSVPCPGGDSSAGKGAAQAR